MRLRVKLPLRAIFIHFAFQFLLVRLRVFENTHEFFKFVYLSIPSGAIKRAFWNDENRDLDSLSIPSGAIKSFR